MFKIGCVAILVGGLILYTNKLAFKKDLVIDEAYVYKKTIAIVFSIIAIGLIFLGAVLLFLKSFF